MCYDQLTAMSNMRSFFQNSFQNSYEPKLLQMFSATFTKSCVLCSVVDFEIYFDNFVPSAEYKCALSNVIIDVFYV